METEAAAAWGLLGSFKTLQSESVSRQGLTITSASQIFHRSTPGRSEWWNTPSVGAFSGSVE